MDSDKFISIYLFNLFYNYYVNNYFQKHFKNGVKVMNF